MEDILITPKPAPDLTDDLMQGIERIGNQALSFGAEAMTLRIAIVEAVAEMQSALGRLKAALASTPRHELIRRRSIDGDYCKDCGGAIEQDLTLGPHFWQHKDWRQDADHPAIAEE